MTWAQFARIASITISVLRGCAEVSLVICSYRAQALPVVLRMYQDRVILRGVEIQDRFQHLICYFDEAQSLINGLFCLTCHDSYRVTHKADSLVSSRRS